MRPARRRLAAAPALFAAAACGGEAADDAPADATAAVEASADPPGIVLADATAASGLDAFVQENGDREKPYIVESIGGGVALLDHDGDGDLDVYFTNGSSLQGFPPGEEPRDALFANDGAARFEDVTDEAGLGDPLWTCGVRVADVDADGRPDLYLTSFGPNVLYRNVGGRFADVTAEAGVAGDGRWSTGACFLDHDRDGDLDLYVASYVDFDRGWIDEHRPRREYKGVSVYVGPQGLPGSADVLYRNDGGRFVDVSTEAGIDGPRLHGFQVAPFDHDVDGWVDVYVANDSQPNLLWRNRGDGTFEDAALRAGLARSKEGVPQAGMGVAVGDADGDLVLDVFVTNFSDDYYTLYLGQGRGLHVDASFRARLALPTRNVLGWSTAFVDLDADGDRDLFCANGHVWPQVDRFDLGTSYRQRSQVFVNDGTATFEELPPAGGLAVARCSRGAAFGDVDGDGDVDVVVSNLDDRPTLLRNDTAPAGSWVRLRLVGAGGNRDAIGARVLVAAGGREQLLPVGAGGGFLSSDEPTLHVGLGAAERVERVLVTWPDGTEEEVRDLPVRTTVTLEQGRGVAATDPAR